MSDEMSFNDEMDSESLETRRDETRFGNEVGNRNEARKKGGHKRTAERNPT